MASKELENNQTGSNIVSRSNDSILVRERKHENGSVPNLLSGMRSKARRYANLGMYRTAGFLANKAMTASDSSAEEVLGFAR